MVMPQPNQRRHYQRWWQHLRRWQRVLLVVVLLGVLVIDAALIYVAPGTPTRRHAPSTTTTPAPQPVPGSDEYYYWGQNRPLDQQP